MRRRLPAIVASFLASLLAAGTTAVAGCSSGSAGHGPTHGASPSGSPVAPTELAAKVTSGLAALRSAHLTVVTGLSHQRLGGSGDIQLANGSVTAADLVQALPGGLGRIEVIVAGGKTYAKLPSGLRNGSRPWLLVNSASSDPTVQSLSSVLRTILGVVSPSGLVGLAKAASSATDFGSSTVDTTPTTHYSLSVPAQKVGAALPGIGSSPKPLTLDLYLDQHDRPVRVTGVFSILGQRVNPDIRLGALNQPVSIHAPTASQVGTG